MEKSLCLLFFLCSALMEAQCLECYVCDNCPKVKLDQIQTCGPTITLGSSTITSLSTESSTTTIVTANVPNISTSTTSKPKAISTTTTSEATTTSSVTTTEATTISTKATDAIVSGSTSTESNVTPIIPLSTPTMASTDSSMTFSENPMNASVNIQISPTTFTSIVIETTTELSRITTTISDNSTTSSTEIPSILITAAPSITTTVTEGVRSSTESADLSSAFTEVSKPVISSLTTSATETSPPDANYLFISTTTAAVPFAITTTEFTSQNVPTLSNPLMAKPVATITPETGPDMPFVSAANYPVLAVGVARPGKEINGANNFRAKTSASENCACKGEPTCDCAATRQRTKRYALRGLGLSKEGVKYVCVIDKYQVNGTEVVKRGCAIKDEDEKTACSRSGFSSECKTCDTNQCNSAAIIQSSIILIFSIYLFNC